MWTKKKLCGLVVAMMTLSCSRPASDPIANVRKIPADKPFTGLLSSYDNLKPNPSFESAVTYVSQDPAKNLHKYVAVIVDPPIIYIASNADEKTLPDRGRAALAEYFQNAITEAVGDAFPHCAIQQ